MTLPINNMKIFPHFDYTSYFCVPKSPGNLIMTKYYYSFFAVLSILVSASSCMKSYNIEGSSDISSLDSRMLYLSTFGDNELKQLDSTEVVHGKFGFTGTTDSVRMAFLGIYFSPEMKDLFNCLKDDKIDVYVCSASLELIVEVLACDPQIGAGLPPEQVFGLRFIPSEHLIARYDESYVQPIGPGKVTCIETLIAPSHGGRGPVLVGGDSNGDVPMLTAFEGMQRGLIIDVGRRADSAIGQLIHSGDSRYLVQPAFAKADGAVEGGGI